MAVPSEAGPSTPRPNRFGRKIMLCVCWDQSGIVYYKLLEPGKTVNAQCYHQEIINFNHALIEKRPEWAKRHISEKIPSIIENYLGLADTGSIQVIV